jgi:hypothetical protein
MSPRIRFFPIEALLWLAAIVALAVANVDGTHFTICPLALAKLDWCPGCGLGRSISYLLHGEITRSISAHPLGIFATIILSYRIVTLIRTHFTTYGKSD